MSFALQIAGLLAVGFQFSCALPLEKNSISPQAYITSADGAYSLSAYTAPVMGPGSTTISSTWALSVDDTGSGHRQQITGFGGMISHHASLVVDILRLT
jgi:hypothetical protein